MQSARGSYWDGFARAYANLGEPLRPSPEEVALMEGVVRDWTASQGIDSPRALLLGATPAIASMEWPETTWLTGIDRSFPMAASVWPGDVPGRRAMVCGDWLRLPLPDNSCDIVIGDGSVNCLPYPLGFRRLAEAAAEVLRPGGLLILRCYLQAEPRECPQGIHSQAINNAVDSFHAFKLRLLMALQPTAQEGVAVNDVHRWVTANVDPVSLPRRSGWTPAEVATIDYYKGSPTVYAFPTLAELRTELADKFRELSLLTPGHPMGPRCPILVFQPRSS
ncbi:MAG: methyltransferase domain-containing protein [Bryobacteraceae bacterium]